MSKAKGTTLIGAVRFLRSQRDRARELLAPELHHYLEERIHESSWYPEEHLLALIEAMLPMIPGSREDVLKMMGTTTAREHLEGVYSHLAGGSAPTASRSFALWASQHDSGRFEVERLSDRETRMTVRDFGHPSEVMCGIFGGYFAETLRLEGAHDVEITKPECVNRGDGQCTWTLTHSPSDLD
jgi:hypothetical protein